MNMNKYPVMHPLHKEMIPRLQTSPNYYPLKERSGRVGKKKGHSSLVESCICIKRGEDLPMEQTEDTEV